MTFEDKQHRRDDRSNNIYWQNTDAYSDASEHLEYDTHGNIIPVEYDPYGRPMSQLDAHGNFIPVEYDPYGRPMSPDQTPSPIYWAKKPSINLVPPDIQSPSSPPSPQKTTSGLPDETINYLLNNPSIISDPSSYKTESERISQTPTSPINSAPSSPTHTESVDRSGQKIPGLPTQGGKPIPQHLQDEFSPKLGKKLDDVRIHEAPELTDFLHAKALAAEGHIFTGKQTTEKVLRFEIANLRNPTVKRWATSGGDTWARQAEAERQRQAAIAAEHKRQAELERQRKAKAAADKAAADKRKQDDITRQKNKAAALARREEQRRANPTSQPSQPHPKTAAHLHPSPQTQLKTPLPEPRIGFKAPLSTSSQAKLQTQPHQTQNAPAAATQSLTPEQQRLLKVQQSQEKAKVIWKDLPPDAKTSKTSLDGKKSLYDQWLDLGKSTLDKGEPKGLEQYFEDNGRTLHTLGWMVNASKQPDGYATKRYKDYLAPSNNPQDKVELVALKQDSLKSLVNEDSPDAKRIGINGSQIVRAVTTTDSSGKPVKEYFAKVGGPEGLTAFDRPAQWVKVKPPSQDQVLVSVDATDITQGKQPKEINTTVNISGGEQQTKKRYNTIAANYQTTINPTFTQYQQLRGDTPRQLSGSGLRNELGVAMNFTPNNAPLTEADQKALKAGNWDLFSSDRISPELSQGLNPSQQEKLKAHFKAQQETLSKVEGKVKEIGGDNAKITTLPIMVDSPELGGIIQTPLFRVSGKDGKDQFVDNTGRVYKNFQDWKDNNKLPEGRVSYFADGHISDKKDEQPNIVTENTHAVVDTPWEHIKQVGDKVAMGVGLVVGAAAIGALILGTGGLATPLVVAGGAAALWGAGSEGSKLYDRHNHQESLSLTDPEARSAWIGLTANMVGFAAIGSSIRAGNAALKVANSVDEMGQVTASATEMSQAAKLAQTSQVLNGASTVTDGVALTDSSYGLAKNWDKLSPEQRLFAIGQIGFWSGMTVHSAHQAMGSKSPYASGDIDQFMHGVASKPKESLTGETPSQPNAKSVGETSISEGVTTASSKVDARSMTERVSDATKGKVALNLGEEDSAVLRALTESHQAGKDLPEKLKARAQEPIELSAEQKQQLGIYSKSATLEDVARRLRAIETKNQAAQQNKDKIGEVIPEEKTTQQEKVQGQESVQQAKNQFSSPRLSSKARMRILLRSQAILNSTTIGVGS